MRYYSVRFTPRTQDPEQYPHSTRNFIKHLPKAHHRRPHLPPQEQKVIIKIALPDHHENELGNASLLANWLRSDTGMSVPNDSKIHRKMNMENGYIGEVSVYGEVMLNLADSDDGQFTGRLNNTIYHVPGLIHRLFYMIPFSQNGNSAERVNNFIYLMCVDIIVTCPISAVAKVAFGVAITKRNPVTNNNKKLATWTSHFEKIIINVATDDATPYELFPLGTDSVQILFSRRLLIYFVTNVML
jgi:hypothetical protein